LIERVEDCWNFEESLAREGRNFEEE